MLRYFIKKVCSFIFASIFFYVLINEFILFRLGESGSYINIINQQNINKKLLGRKFSNEDLSFKIIGSRLFQADMLVLGTSRVMSLKSNNFTNHSFYNASVNASSSRGLFGMKYLLSQLEDLKLPKFLILGLDPWLFNPNYPENQLKKDSESKIRNFKNYVRKKYPDYFYKFKKMKDVIFNRTEIYVSLAKSFKSWLALLLKNRSYNGFGLNAKLYNSGYRYDGSYKYPANYNSTWIDDYEAHANNLLTNNYKFAPSTFLDENSILELNDLLDFSRRNNIYVIALLPPLSPNFYKALLANNKRSLFLAKYQTKIPLIINDYGFKCFNFTDVNNKLKKFKSNFLDSIHADDLLMDEIAKLIAEEINK